jgi:hypothetical protein
MTTDAPAERMKARFGEDLWLREVRGVCPGIVRAVQILSIGKEEIAGDEVLIEEVAYPSVEMRGAELKSFSLKAGLFSPFEHVSTPPPKYYYVDQEAPVAWFVNSVPPVSLAMVLDKIEESWPSHYTWNRMAYVRDWIGALRGGLGELKRGRRKPLRALTTAVNTVRESLPGRIGPLQRMQLAALLVDNVRGKHDAGIYHNNIIAETIFFPNPLSPRLLSNYAGVDPAMMSEHVPEIIRNRPRETTFGPQSQDTYALALLTYRIIVGQKLDGKRFEMDPPLDLEPALPAFLTTRVRGVFSFIDKPRELLRETWRHVLLARNAFNASLDESNWRNFRKLNRASGSVLRSIPYLRRLADMWAPTGVATVLRCILDGTTNDKFFGPRSSLNRSATRPKNVDCTYLRLALPRSPLRPGSRPARLIQDVIDRAAQRPTEIIDEDFTTAWLSRRPRMRAVGRWALTAALLLLVYLFTNTHYRASVSRQPPGQNAAATQQLSPAHSTQPPATSPPNTCRARIVPVTGVENAYRVTDLTDRCAFGDIRFRNPHGGFQTLRSLAGSRTRFYVRKDTREGYGAITAVRLCLERDGICEWERFYEVGAQGGFGDPVSVVDGDLFAFSRTPLTKVR